jgi:hypothetical protein
MTTGAVYSLLIDNGPQDKFLRATNLLNLRINKNKRKQQPFTINDIEKSHMLFMVAKFKPYVAMTFEYHKISAPGKVNFGSKIKYEIPNYGEFLSDMFIHIKLSAVKAKKNNNPDNSANGKIKYVNFIGQKILSQVAFCINNNQLDSYCPEVCNNYYNFFLKKDLRKVYKKMVGQESTHSAYVDDNYNDNKLQYKILDGLQTYKTQHEAFELLIPIEFWFNKDPRLALPILNLGLSKKILEIDIANITDLLFGDEFISPKIELMDLYVNNIYINPEIQDIYSKKLQYQMIRVHKFEKKIIDKSNDKILLDFIRWPVEYIMISAHLQKNIDEGKWNECALLQKKAKSVPVVQTTYNGNNNIMKKLALTNASYYRHIPLIKSLAISSMGKNLHSGPANIFENYMAYKYGPFTVSPKGCGKYLIPLCLYPGIYQPSGHFNFSRSRENYITYQSNNVPLDWDTAARNPGEPIINNNNPVYLFVIAVCINFLLIENFSAILKYTT